MTKDEAVAAVHKVAESSPFNSAQQQVYDAVVARGYRAGWTHNQFLSRQIMKLQEELRELMIEYSMDAPALSSAIETAGIIARDLFDSGVDVRGGLRFKSSDYPLLNYDEFFAELADLQVVIFCIAATLQELRGEQFDIVAAAKEKATKDIKRGVR